MWDGQGRRGGWRMKVWPQENIVRAWMHIFVFLEFCVIGFALGAGEADQGLGEVGFEMS